MTERRIIACPCTACGASPLRPCDTPEGKQGIWCRIPDGQTPKLDWDALAFNATALWVESQEPIPMRLVCEACGKLHIDEGDFATKPHHTHVCQHCGLTWRPAIVPTVGVRFLPGFKSETAKPPAGRGEYFSNNSFSEGLGSQANEWAAVRQASAVKRQPATPSWEPKPGVWARLEMTNPGFCGKSPLDLYWGGVVLLGEFSKLTGRFTAVALDGVNLYPRHDQLQRWIPRIDERVCVHGSVHGTVVNNGFDPGPEGLPFFMVKMNDGVECKAYLSDLDPAPPDPIKPSGFKVGDWVRVTKKGSEFFDVPRRVHEVKALRNVECARFEGDPGWFDLAILEHWKPRQYESVVHKKSGVTTTINALDGTGNLFYTAHAFNGRRWFELDELEPYVTRDIPNRPPKQPLIPPLPVGSSEAEEAERQRVNEETRADNSRCAYIHELENALRNASALLRGDAFSKTIDALLAQGRPSQ